MPVTTSRDEAKEQVKEAFVLDPQRLVSALSLRVDERKSKGNALWVFDGAEDEASLLINGKCPGLCTRFGDDWHGDCFGLVQRFRPQMPFKERLEFVAQVYGIEMPANAPKAHHGNDVTVTSETKYRILSNDGEVLAIHTRRDMADGSKRMWWGGADGSSGLSEDLGVNDLPLWRSWELQDRKPGGVVVVCEGEKDADAVWQAGGVAVGTYGADAIPTPNALSNLRGHPLVLWPDNDAPGSKHMSAVSTVALAAGFTVSLLSWPDAPAKAGAADWLASGGDKAALVEMVRAAQPVIPEPTDAEIESAIAQAVDSVPYADPVLPPMGAVPIADIAAGIIESVEFRRNLENKVYGLRSGFPSIDNHLNGFAWQGIILVCGDAKRGKTTFARQCAFATCQAMRDEKRASKVLFYVLEGGQDQFLRYYCGWKYGIPSRVLRPGSETHLAEHPEWRDALMEAYSDFPRLPLYVCDGITDADKILHDIERHISEGPVEGVIVDNIQLLTYPWANNEWTGSRNAAKAFLDLTDKTKVPIMMLSQVNRDKTEWKPRGGPEWRNNATAIFYIDRGERGDPDEKKLASNLMTVACGGFRYDDAISALSLYCDADTKRLYEQWEWERLEAQQHAMASGRGGDY